MAAKIIKSYKEHIPAVTLIGKVYHVEDRDSSGSFGANWGQWFTHGWFDALKGCGKPYADDYVGAMRMNKEGVFEYWIGILMASVERVPEGYVTEEIPAGEFAVAWIKGREDGGLYAMHEECMKTFKEQGWTIAKAPWYIEKYVCPRFTTPDEQGEVILDYAVSLAE